MVPSNLIITDVVNARGAGSAAGAGAYLFSDDSKKVSLIMLSCILSILALFLRILFACVSTMDRSDRKWAQNRELERNKESGQNRESGQTQESF